MARTAPDYLKRLGLSGLLKVAHARPGEEMGAAALSLAVLELLEVEVEHRMTHGHDNNGYASASPLAFAGEGAGTGVGESDRLLDAASRYYGANAWRGLALELLAPLRERPRRAALVSAYLIRPTGATRRSPRMMTAREACRPENLAAIYQRLGWPPQPVPAFADASALDNAARNARKRMCAALAERLAAVGCELGSEPPAG